MPSTSKIGELFGVVGKEAAKKEHLVNAAVGAGIGTGAKAAYNFASGKDTTDGLWKGALGGAATGSLAGAGWKAYKNSGLAERVAQVGKEVKDSETFRSMADKANETRQNVGSKMKGWRNRPVGKGTGPIEDSMGTSHRGTTMKSNKSFGQQVSGAMGWDDLLNLH